MTIWAILSIAIRFIGFARWADALWEKHEDAVKKQAGADTPKTDAEWTQKSKDGEL